MSKTASLATPNIPLIKKAIADIKATPLDEMCTGDIYNGKKCCAVGLMLKSAGETLIRNPSTKKSWKFPDDQEPYRIAYSKYIKQYDICKAHYGIELNEIISLNDMITPSFPHPNIQEVLDYLQGIVEANSITKE